MVRRSTTRSDAHRRRLLATKPPCGICGDPIDYSLPSSHPKSFVVDHIVPLARGGADVPSNTQAACRDCNRAKGAKPFANIVKRSGSLRRPGS